MSSQVIVGEPATVFIDPALIEEIKGGVDPLIDGVTPLAKTALKESMGASLDGTKAVITAKLVTTSAAPATVLITPLLEDTIAKIKEVADPKIEASVDTSAEIAKKTIKSGVEVTVNSVNKSTSSFI